MNKEKQIKEMAVDMYVALPDDEHNLRDCRNAATEMIAKGWHKQNEWISVDERLPDRDGRYLVAMKNGDDYHVSTRKFKRTDPPIWWKGHTFGYWARYTGGVRYWMPLPEVPKMKGGESDA